MPAQTVHGEIFFQSLDEVLGLTPVCIMIVKLLRRQVLVVGHY
jgi:hypothetical protein